MFQHGASSVHHLCYVLLWFRARLFIDALWSPAEPSFVMSSCHFPRWYPWSGVVLDCIDS